MTNIAYAPIPLDLPDERRHRQMIAEAANGALYGRLLITGTLTLAAGAATTTVTDVRSSVTSVILLSPRTANAAAALANTYVSTKSNGSFILTHANNGQTDRDFDYIVIGQGV
jgi:hypothetical protein